MVALIHTTGANLLKDIQLYYMKKDRERLVETYGEEKVEWAEDFVERNKFDYQDERDRNYP